MVWFNLFVCLFFFSGGVLLSGISCIPLVILFLFAYFCSKFEGSLGLG